jgi:hypothetical protein
MARRKKPPAVKHRDACECAMRRAHVEVKVWTDGPGASFDCRKVGQEMFCACRVCGTRWQVTVIDEYDHGLPDTSYVWTERPWTDEEVAARQYEALYAVKQEREREERAEDSRQHDPFAGHQKETPAAPAGALHPTPPGIEQTGPEAWRWVDAQGVAHGCSIDGSRISAWTEGPWGGSGTAFDVDEFLEGRHAKTLPSAVAGRVLQALNRRKE